MIAPELQAAVSILAQAGYEVFPPEDGSERPFFIPYDRDASLQSDWRAIVAQVMVAESRVKEGARLRLSRGTGGDPAELALMGLTRRLHAILASVIVEE